MSHLDQDCSDHATFGLRAQFSMLIWLEKKQAAIND
jgi:hypothetical protein